VPSDGRGGSSPPSDTQLPAETLRPRRSRRLLRRRISARFPATQPKMLPAMRSTASTWRSLDVCSYTACVIEGLAWPSGLESFVTNELRNGVLQGTEDEIINGDGTGIRFAGLLNQRRNPSRSVRSASSTRSTQRGHGSGELLRARCDRALADGRTDDPSREDRYRRVPDGRPERGRSGTLFGKRLVMSPLMPAGTGLVGAFQQGATVYDRPRASDRVGDGGPVHHRGGPLPAQPGEGKGGRAGRLRGQQARCILRSRLHAVRHDEHRGARRSPLFEATGDAFSGVVPPDR
jgi:hypothetical protein